jgi:hypothetical protein
MIIVLKNGGFRSRSTHPTIQHLIHATLDKAIKIKENKIGS